MYCHQQTQNYDLLVDHLAFGIQKLILERVFLIIISNKENKQVHKQNTRDRHIVGF